jgi:hypothetical protein
MEQTHTLKQIIISQPWGGLGDNLQYSTLPELFSKNGYVVYISKNNVTRDTEIYDIVWGGNPYIKGIVNLKPNAGECKNVFWPPASNNEYFIHRIEISHGLKKTNFYPKIYYIPNYLQEFSNDVIIDLTGTSQVFGITKYLEYIDYFTPLIINRNKIKIVIRENIRQNPFFEEVYSYLKTKIPNVCYLKVNNLIQYCDIIKSCDTLIIVNSGLNSLSSAIKQDDPKPHVLCYYFFSHFSKEEMKGYYFYKNIEYFQSKIT